MKPTIRIAQRTCESAKARQAIVVWFDEHDQFAVASYGETVAECSAVKPVCNAIADMFDSGYLDRPGADANGDERPDRRRGELGGWNEYDRIRNERDLAVARAQAAEKFRDAVTTLVAIYERQDEPEGPVSRQMVLTAIAETLGPECSFCRRRHGSEIQHAAE